jgi:hypothetical protein
MSIKVSDKVKKLMVHVLKHWSSRAVSRFKSSELELPSALVERYVREVCTSKMLLPVLGKAIFPYFNKSAVDFALVSQIMQVKISDALLHLFDDRGRRTPEIPVRLSYSETVGAGGDAEAEADAIDWADVSFDDEPEAAEPEHVDIVFAGNRYFEHWAAQLPAFYVRNAGGKTQSALDDPRTKALVDALGTVESVRP